MKLPVLLDVAVKGNTGSPYIFVRTFELVIEGTALLISRVAVAVAAAAADDPAASAAAATDSFERQRWHAASLSVASLLLRWRFEGEVCKEGEHPL